MPFAVQGVHVRPVRQQEMDQLDVPGDDREVQRGEAVLVPGLDQGRISHHQKVRTVRTLRLPTRAIMQGRFQRPILAVQ